MNATTKLAIVISSGLLCCQIAQIIPCIGFLADLLALYSIDPFSFDKWCPTRRRCHIGSLRDLRIGVMRYLRNDKSCKPSHCLLTYY